LITQTLVTAAIEGPGLVCSGRLSGSNWYYKGEQVIQWDETSSRATTKTSTAWNTGFEDE